MKPCIIPGCPQLTRATRCATHQAEYEAARGTSTQRGYGTAHRRTRARLLPDAYGKPCHLCGELMLTGQRLALDHTPDRTGYRGMAHEWCNNADGGRRAHDRT